MTDFISKARIHAQQSEITLPEDIILDGSIHRFAENPTKPNQKDGWYIGYDTCGDDGKPFQVIVYSTWREGFEKQTVSSWGADSPSKSQIAAMERAREASEQEEKIRHEEAKERALEIWNRCEECAEHPYLTAKGVSSHGLRVYKDSLVIPVYSAESGELISLQFISRDGEKRFLRGGSTKHGCFQIGSGDDLFIGEGYATCATAYEATGKPCLVSFSCHNIIGAWLHTRNKRKLNTARLLQDLGSAGEKVADEWRRSGYGSVCIPDWKEKPSRSDWNDLAQDLGKEEVAKQLQPRRIPVVSMCEFVAMPHPKPEWLVENLMMKGSVNMIYAPQGTAKSLMALDLGFAVHCGQPFWRKPSRKSSCVLIDAEMSNWELAQRIDSYSTRYVDYPEYFPRDNGPGIHTREMMQRELGESLNIYSAEHRELLNEVVQGYDFIILDNLFTMTERSTEDNFRKDQAEWNGFCKWARNWSNQGKTFLILHHTTKSGAMALSHTISIEMQTVLKLEPVPNRFLSADGDLAINVSFSKHRHVTGRAVLPWVAMLHNTEQPFRIEPIPETAGPGKWSIFQSDHKTFREAQKK